VAVLEEAMERFGRIVEDQRKIRCSRLEGAGAAGGTGAGIAALLGGSLKRGIDVMLDTLRFNDILDGCSLVITGEGRVDNQTARGKLIHGISVRSSARKVPVLVLAGSCEGSEEQVASVLGVDAIATLVNNATPLSEAMRHAPELLRSRAAEAVRAFASIT
jgi:glycerate kinase